MNIGDAILDMAETLVRQGDVKVVGVVRTWSANQMHHSDTYPTDNISFEFDSIDRVVKIYIEVEG